MYHLIIDSRWPTLPRKYNLPKTLTKFFRCVSQTSSNRVKMPRTEKVVFSAIQPTGIPHLGNYLGAMINWVKLQESENCDTKLIFSVADLHALTMPQEPGNFKKARMQTLASMLAVGLDEERCTIFMQSEFGLVTELMWILSCTASLGYLSRMTQWKSKMGLKQSSFENSTSSTKTKLGLLSYPVLQAADILIHRATHVPVGADQAQHLEFARECVTNFNSTYSPVFVKPETLLSPSRRIKSLTNQEVKMSKSSGPKNSRILITDTKEEIRAKFSSAITDSDNRVSWDPENRPGVANLLTILSAFDTLGRAPKELAESMEGINLRELKNLLSQNVEEKLLPIREQYNKLIADHDYLNKIAARGLEKAYATGHQNLRLVREAIGLC
ncbi:Tryptophan--tRNA ligase, mitochondrial [Erysiphe neolycopersici]|uniref:Tryptophan--tRNA ligase, mitochondrial n=1 Tax=Erysiphe neolycopersici TaxID=212602 RepID=A0A420HS65_9PEZI|nr:Tryptophan--tRNA ligase, mitochondrial [Erysiphe neolycopersici]